MTIYLLQVFTILLLSAGIHPMASEKKKKWFLLLSFLVLTMVSGIRGYSVGADTPVYVALFNNIDYISVSYKRYETGFIIYFKLLHWAATNPAFMLFITSAICIGTVCFFAFRTSKSPTISILLYFLLGGYFSQMNIMRQAIGLSITMWAFLLLLEDNKYSGSHKKWHWVLAGLYILLAMSFHMTAVVTIIPLFLLLRHGANEDESKLTIQYSLSITIVLSIIVFVGYAIVMRVTSSLFPSYAGYFYSTWSDSNYRASLANSLIDAVFLIAGAIILKGHRLTYLQRFSVIMIGLSLVFHVLSMRMEIWGRVAGYFNIYTYLIWVPEFLNGLKLRTNRKITRFAIVGFSFLYMMIVLIFRPEWTKVVPYVVNKIL